MSPFLTQIDSRAAIRGSRDPLSLVPIWASFGRRVVGNLTTASTSLRGFTTLLLGYYCVERIAERSPDESPLNVFIRLEQLAGYSRVFVNPKDTDFRGSDRVHLRLADSSRVTLSADPQYQILGDQKTYGLWGLYSVASRTSGVLFPDRPALTPEATEFVERQYGSKLARAGLGGMDALLKAVAWKKRELDLRRNASDLAVAVGKLHGTKVDDAERSFYQRYLVNGGEEQNTDHQQPILAELLDRVSEPEFGMAQLDAVIARADKLGYSELVDRLRAIRRLECLIVPAANLFAFLLRCDGRTLNRVERDVRQEWGRGLRTLRGEVSSIVERDITALAKATEAAAHLGHFGRSAAAGDWRAAIEGLVQFNTYVMGRRGGAPWVRLDAGTVRVDYREEGGDLDTPGDLERPWSNTYFINALYGIQRQLAVR